MSGNIPNTAEVSLAALSANICAELACGLSDSEGIKRRYELTDNEWKKLKASRFFRSMLKEALQKFAGDMNAGKRITVKSEVALEDSIPLLHKWAHDPEIAISNRLDAIKQMAVLAGRTAKDQTPQGGPSNGGPGFNVNIIVKGNDRREVIDVTSTPLLEAEAVGAED